MKISYLLGVLLLAIITSMLISTMSAPSTYANFSEALRDPGKEYTVIGTLNSQKKIHYDPRTDPNLVQFYMRDKNGVELPVILNQSKPQDMERSEDVVVKGAISNGTFYAHTILLKCPSKYEEKNNFTSQK
jgi:cytochrome c-type biogenesis protein CcmE